MSITSRRGFLGAMAVSGATLAASRAAAAPDKLDLAALKMAHRPFVSHSILPC